MQPSPLFAFERSWTLACYLFDRELDKGFWVWHWLHKHWSILKRTVDPSAFGFAVLLDSQHSFDNPITATRGHSWTIDMSG